MRKPAQLRQLLSAGVVPMPGAFNALTARLIERVGFPAVYVSGAGLTNATCGVPDIGLIGLEEFARLAGYVAAAVKVPVVCDADTGFGGPSNAARTVQLYERAGLAGLHLEDQEFPKRCGHLAGKDVVPCDEMVARLKAATAARTDPDFLIIARTDARAMPAPLMANMTEFGKGRLLPLADLAAMGYRMVIYPQTALRVMMKTAAEALRELKQAGTQAGLLDRMQTRQELYDLLNYDPAAENWPG
jgi:methylisocitrate lyase